MLQNSYKVLWIFIISFLIGMEVYAADKAVTTSPSNSSTLSSSGVTSQCTTAGKSE